MEVCESPRIPFKVLYERFETGKIPRTINDNTCVYSSKL